MKGILGKKIGMTSIFTNEGINTACTVIEAGPCLVTAIKTVDNNGYSAVQLGFQKRKEKGLSKPQLGKFKKLKITPQRYVKEIRDYELNDELQVGSTVDVGIFNEGDTVKVTGYTKGKGFQGAVKRHGFGGGFKTHGQSDRLRAPGSIGASSYPSRVFKGQKMAGRDGNDKVTIRNLKVVKIIPESNLILIKGAVPGSISGIVEIYKK
jgi:large subunit ribosomal protein L3